MMLLAARMGGGGVLVRVALWAALAVLAVAPLATILLGALLPSRLGGDGGLFAALPWAAAGNSLLLGAGVAALSCAVALALVLLAERAAPPGIALWEALLFLPFLSPPYQLGLAWSALALPGGIFGRHLGGLAVPLKHFVFSLPGMAFITASHLVPLIYAMLRGYLAGTGWRHELAARVHGIGRWPTFLRVTLPRLAMPLAAGGLIAFLAAVDEFGVPAVLGPYLGFSVLTTEIQSDLDVWPIDLAGATQTAVVLLGMGLLAWSLYRRYDNTTVLDHRGPRGVATRYDAAGWAASLGFGAWVVLTSILPIAVLVTLSLLRAETAGLRADNLTLLHFVEVLTPGQEGFLALSTSFNLAWTSSAIALALATCIAFASLGGRRGDRALDAVTTLLNALPAIVLSVALVMIWNAPWNPVTLYGHAGVLVVAYVTVLLPLALRYAKTAAARVDPRLLAAARVHGVGGAARLGRIILPLMLPPLVGGFAVAMAFSMREFVASVLLQPPGLNTVSTFIFNEAEQGNSGAAMAMTVISMALSFATVGALHAWLGWRTRRLPVAAAPAGVAAGAGPIAVAAG